MTLSTPPPHLRPSGADPSNGSALGGAASYLGPHCVTAVFFCPNGEPVFRCACWLTFSGRTPRIWTATRHDDGTATFSPSVHLPGHLHEFANRIPIARSMEELARNPEAA